MAQTRIKLTIGGVVFQAELNTSQTAEAVRKCLPISARGNLWGEQIYFSIPAKCQPENAREVVDKGVLAYWPPGNAFCIFWGPTPASAALQVQSTSLAGLPVTSRLCDHSERQT
jgi:hypothetical protein